MSRIALGVAFLLAMPPGLAGQAPEARAIDAGRKVYAAEKCFTCHQIAGKGNKVFPLDGVGSRLTPAQIRRWFTHTVAMEDQLPKRPAILMSSRKYKLSAAELDALVAYLYSLKKQEGQVQGSPFRVRTPEPTRHLFVRPPSRR